MQENPEFLTSQIITYIGNKRLLIANIENEIFKIEKELHKEKLVCADLFSGSGIVARMLKSHSSLLIANDLENYSTVLNACYLTNKSEFDAEKYEGLKKKILRETEKAISSLDGATKKIEVANLDGKSGRGEFSNPNSGDFSGQVVDSANRQFSSGIITQNYAPKNTNDIKAGERTFYTHENAVLIDTYRRLIDEIVPLDMQKFFLAPLITEASVHVNTSGVFKGFYKDPNTGIGCFGGVGKNALSRIFGKIELKTPIFSNFECDVKIHQKDTVELSGELKGLDVAYLDPPYNQHPYGSNYFMLNLILANKIPEEAQISRVSGIPSNWNHSVFNKRAEAFDSLEKIIANLDAKYVVISYNSEGFIAFNEMSEMLKKYGDVKIVQIPYNTFRGSRNLSGREIYVKEYLFILRKII